MAYALEPAPLVQFRAGSIASLLLTDVLGFSDAERHLRPIADLATQTQASSTTCSGTLADWKESTSSPWAVRLAKWQT